MAHACREVLQEKGISDVHCLVFEADLVTRTQDIQSDDSGGIGTIPRFFSSQTDSSSDSSFVPFELRDHDWETHYLERRLVLRLTDKIGQPISPCDNPTKFGSTGLFIRLGTSSGSGSQSSTGTHEQTYLLTNRHVVCPDGMTKDIGHPSPPREDRGGCFHNNTKAEAPAIIDMIQPGIVEFGEVMAELKRAISQKQKYINEKCPLYNDGGDDMAGRPGPSTRYIKTLRELEGLQKFQRYCCARRSSTARRVGPVAFSPALGIRNKSRRDWALISSAYQGANSSCIFDLGSKDKDILLERVRPEFPVTVEGHTNDEDAAPDFINLDGVCSRETIEQNHTIPHLPDGAIKAEASDEDTADDRKFLVYKYGATTGSTCGALNCISSRHIDQVEGICTDYCIIGSDKVFSAKGDSGSAIFGLLPIPTPDSSYGSNRVLKRQAEDDGGPHHKVITAKHRYTPAVIGIIWGGHESPWSAPHDDVTYAIPIMDVLDDIKEYTGRPVVGLKSYRSEPLYNWLLTGTPGLI